MIHTQITQIYYNPLSSWEAPWNHMTYFWHDDPKPSGENQISCNITSAGDSVLPIHERSCCQVKEIQLPSQPYEEKNPCNEDIEAIKPIPWRNVFPPPNILCNHRRKSRSSANQDDPNTLEEIMSLCDPGNAASPVVSTPTVRKSLVLKPLACTSQNYESPKEFFGNKINPESARKGPAILPLCRLSYNFDKLGEDKMEKKKQTSLRFDTGKDRPSNSPLQDVKRTLSGSPFSNKYAVCASKTDQNPAIKRPYSATNTFPQSQKGIPAKQMTSICVKSNTFGETETKENNSSTRRDTQVCSNCRYGLDRSQCSQGKKVQSKELNKKPILKMKKAPQPIRTSMENIDRWKKEAAEEARAKLFQSIREAPRKRNPGLKCEDELSLSSNLCSFCNQPLSPFGYCNECLPPTPVAKSIPDEAVIKQSKSCCLGLNNSTSTESQVLTNANNLLNEINKFRATFFNPGVSSSHPQTNHDTSDIESLMKPQDFQEVSQSDAHLPVATQMQTCYDQFQRDLVSPPPNQETPTYNQANTNWQSLAPTQPTTCPCFSQCQSMMPCPPPPPQDHAHYPFNFHHPYDCPLQTPMQYNSFPLQRNLYFPSPMQPFVHDQTRNIYSQAQYPNNYVPLTPLVFGSVNNARYNSTSASFAATLDVGNASPHDINVIVYANRVLVAEAVNRTANGESVSAQSWALPPGVDVETLRCYLDVDKLCIIAYPPPPSFNWKFSKTPAALGPPRFLNVPCPFDP